MHCFFPIGLPFLLAFEINGLESWVAESSVSINQVLLGDAGGRT